ncbi:MAG: flagellar basal-body MS-ring/collar protein FliF [Burkholderiaceae bacterium]|nr:flagellar basal-body MS-ring/collar protein FliF [Burkholderiaceae bacterium]
METTAVVPSTLQPAAGPAGGGVFAQMSPRTRGMLLLGAAALAAVVAAAYLWSSSPTYRVLFTNLSDRDGGAIIAQLSQMNIPYKNADGGTLLVPQDKVHEARLKLASAGLPKGSVVGFEIMETQRFGVTQFQEQVNYQRALEGELGRSIQTLAPVAGARVHLALPKQSGFLRDKQPPTASVLLQMHPGKALDRQQVAGIVHLVSSSVPELNPKNVSVVDQHGNLLASDRQGAAGLDAAQLDYVARIEADTIKRIEDILEPIMGRGNVRAQVTADVDFSQVENMAETYAPNQGADTKAAIRSQSTQESSQPGPATPQGIPGALSNQPPTPPTAPINGAAPPLNPAQGAAAAGSSTRRDAVTNFEVDKTVRHTKVASGQIKRLSAAVVVNHRTKPGEGGAAATSTPLADEEVKNINALVREAMGFNEKRGDSLNVVNSAFSTVEIGTAEALPVWKQPDVVALGKEVGKALLFLLLTMIVVFGVVRPALKAVATAPKAPVRPLAAPEPMAALSQPDELRPRTPIDQVRDLAKSDPATVANVVKAWVGEGKA